MASSMGQADYHHLSTASHLNDVGTMHPAAFANPLASDYRERYLMEMHTAAAAYGRSSSFGNGSPSSFYHHQQPMESSSTSSVWQQQLPVSDMHHLHHPAAAVDNTIRGSSALLRGEHGGSDSMNRGESATPTSVSLQNSSPELYHHHHDNSDRFDALSMYFPSSPPAHNMTPSPHPSGGGVRGLNTEGTMIRELIGRMGGNSSMGGGSSGIVSHGGSLVSSPQPSHRSGAGVAGMEKSLCLVGNGWNSTAAEGPNSVDLLSLDPSKGGGGGLVSAINRVGLVTSHSLAHCSSDPGFAERAARFSSFSNGSYVQPFSPNIDPAKLRSRSSASLLQDTSSTKHQLSRTSSCPPVRQRAGGVNNSPPRELHTESTVCENHETASDNLLAGKLEGNEEVQGNNSSGKILSRSASNIYARDMEEEEESSQGGVSAAVGENVGDAPDPVGMQGMSSSPERATGAASPSGGTSGGSDLPAKKRKNNSEEKPKDLCVSLGGRDVKTLESDDAKAKRYKQGDVSKEKDQLKPKAERSSSETSGETSPRSMKDHSKPSEPPKPDYIHVRARRGQATDSHSLAERVRREKISERMKFLQDLVPGCSKVTGKAVMLDEIINYVQSLQRQVEFLSMKLASVNPRLDFNLESFLGKEGPHTSQAMVLGPDTSLPYPQMHHQGQLEHGLPIGLDYPPSQEATLGRSMSMPERISHADSLRAGFCQTVWDDGELQSIVQMGHGHPQSMSSQGLHCHLPPGQVKVELQQSPISCL